MAKRKRISKKATAAKTVEHTLPGGFWMQIGALCMIALSVLLVMTWFHAGGRALEWLGEAFGWLIGYAAYLLPLLLVFLAVKIFRNEDNRISPVVITASALIVLWFAGIFGLFKNHAGNTTGGVIGFGLNKALLLAVDTNVAIFIYILLILITTLFILSLNPKTLFTKISDSLKSAKVEKEDEKNATVMTKAEPAEPIEAKSISKPWKPLPKPDTGASQKVASETIKLNPNSNWKLPSLDLLDKKEVKADPGDIDQRKDIIRDTYKEFGFNVEMDGVIVGPRVSQYTLLPPRGTKMNKLASLDEELRLHLAADDPIRIQAPIPGTNYVGVEIPNKKKGLVSLYEILSTNMWAEEVLRQPLAFALGKDILGSPVIESLSGDTPHYLVAGQSGSGKSYLLNGLIASLIYHNTPDDLNLILIDPKDEFAQWDGLPHLLVESIKYPKEAQSALMWAIKEMDRRYELIARNGNLKKISKYNKKVASGAKMVDEKGDEIEGEVEKMPYLVIAVDEYAALVSARNGKEIDALISKLASLGRAAGIHLILAMQRPEVKVLTGIIKNNISGRIALSVKARVDSMTMLDEIGAEKLLGEGDMLYVVTGKSTPVRVQAAGVSDDEVDKVVEFWQKQQLDWQPNMDILNQVVEQGKGGIVIGGADGNDDELFRDAVQLILDSPKATTNLLQRRLGVGYNRAARLMDMMEDRGIVGPPNGSKPREVFISSIDEID